MKYNSTIAPLIESIVQARKAMNLTQAQLGKELGLPQSYISRLESGKLDIRLSGILEIARFLRLDLTLVPLNLVPAVRAITSGGNTVSFDKPLYSLDDIEEEED